jgi:biofilm PGA synthesis protein PgaA
MFCALFIVTDALSLTTVKDNAKLPDESKSTRAQIVIRACKLSDEDRMIEAEKLLEQHLRYPYRPVDLPLLKIRAELYQRRKDHVNEAAIYQAILQMFPNDKLALHGRAFAAMHMQAFHLAAIYAEQTPKVFSEEEILAFHQASAGRKIKWGVIETKSGLGRQRFQATDMALLNNEALMARHGKQDNDNSVTGRFARFDRLVALRDRMRMDEVVALYNSLKRQHINIPAYALVAVADAFLYQRQPSVARDLYLHALALSRNDMDYPNREWQLKLFDAYVELNDFDAARDLIDRLVATITPVLNKGLRGVEADNELYEQAKVDEIRARLFADQLSDAQDRLNRLLGSAPFNIDARLAKADLLQFREQPRHSQQQYASILVDDPGNNSASVGVAETAIALNDSLTAKQQLDTLSEHYPEDREVQRVQTLLHDYAQPSVSVDSGWGRSPTGLGNRGSQNWQVETFAHSSLYQYNWRGFVHAFNAEADFGDVTGIRRRIGIGLDYRSLDWLINGEMNQEQTRLDRYGFALTTAWIPNDHWQLDFKFESNSNKIPLQASAAKIRMHATEIGIDYNHNESRHLNASVGYAWLSDGNERIEAGASWQERWWSGSTYKLDTVLSIGSTINTLADAAYFNPLNDFSIDMQVINDWLLWRDYQRSFKHRIVFGVGEYWQQGFASGMTGIVRYEQEVNMDAYRTLRYGVAYERHPYDGQQNESTTAFLNLTWHL